MELVFNAPDGCTFDKNRIKIEDGKITIQAEEKQKFSRNWEEFCENNPKSSGECYLDVNGVIVLRDSGRRSILGDTTLVPQKFIGPMRALMKLLTIREKEYTKGWEPDWGNCFETRGFILIPEKMNWISPHWSSVLSFPTKELRDEFEKNWKDLIEIAKPLL